MHRFSLISLGFCLTLLTGSDSLRPWGARSVDRAKALLAQVEALSISKQNQILELVKTSIPQIKPETQKNKKPKQKIKYFLSKVPQRKTEKPRSSSNWMLLHPDLPAPVPVQIPQSPLGSAALGVLSLADLDAPDPVVPAGPPAPQVKVRLPVFGLCKPEKVRLQVERSPGGALRGEPRWLSTKPSVLVERRLQIWLDQAIPGAPSRQQLLVEAVPLGEDKTQLPKCI